MTKTYLIDDYFESQNKIFTNNNQNNNNNNLSFKCVTKLGDIVSGHENNGNPDYDHKCAQEVVSTRVRHHSQQQRQQLTNHVINESHHCKHKITFNKDIDENISINSYESEEQPNYLSKKIESTLREAKEVKRLNCNEILIPQMLTTQIAEDIIVMAETEPCGLRGCILYINIEEKTLCRRLGEIKLDKSSVPTFEMYLTLKRAIPSWIDSIENKLLRKESVILSEIYRLSKKKLYRSLSSP